MQDTVLTSSRPPCDACAAGIHCFGGRCPCCCREPEPGQGALAAIRGELDALDGLWADDLPAGRAVALLTNSVERISQIASGSRTASGMEPDGSLYLTAADAPLVVGALADAADLLEHRAGQFCPDCERHPAELCEEHAADLGQADAYRSMLAKLTEHSADPALARIYDSALAKLTGSAPASNAEIAPVADSKPGGCPPWCDLDDDHEVWDGAHHACYATSVAAAPYVVEGMTHYESACVMLIQGDGGEPVICMEMPANPDGSADGIPMTLAEAAQVSDSLTALIAAARGVCPDCGVPADDGRACTGDVLILGRALAEATKPATDQP